jgi:hypothetical protein
VDAEHRDEEQPGDLEYGRSEVQHSIILKDPELGGHARDHSAGEQAAARQKKWEARTYVTNFTSFKIRATRKMRRILTTRITLALLFVVATAP